MLAHYRLRDWTPTAIWTFPTKTDVAEFSKARAKPMIAGSILLKDLRPGTREGYFPIPPSECKPSMNAAGPSTPRRSGR